MAQRQNSGRGMQLSLDKPLFFILLYKLALRFTLTVETQPCRTRVKPVVAGIQTVSREPPVYREESHQGHPFKRPIYWIYDVDTNFIHLLALSKIVLFFHGKKPLIFKWKDHIKKLVCKKQPPRTFKQQSEGGKDASTAHQFPSKYYLTEYNPIHRLRQFTEFFIVFLRRKSSLLQCFQMTNQCYFLVKKATGRFIWLERMFLHCWKICSQEKKTGVCAAPLITHLSPGHRAPRHSGQCRLPREAVKQKTTIRPCRVYAEPQTGRPWKSDISSYRALNFQRCSGHKFLPSPAPAFNFAYYYIDRKLTAI